MDSASSLTLSVVGRVMQFRSGNKFTPCNSTVLVLSMASRIWKETERQPGTAGPGNRLGCCLISFHFLWAILSTSTVQGTNFIASQELRENAARGQRQLRRRDPRNSVQRIQLDPVDTNGAVQWIWNFMMNCYLGRHSGGTAAAAGFT